MTIRPARPQDIPALVGIHQEVFGHSNAATRSLPDLAYEQVLFSSPGGREHGPGLVFEQDGEVVGFMGTGHRSMSLEGEPVHAVVPTKFMVDPAANGPLVALRLLRALFGQGHDLLISDWAAEALEPLWLRMGGFFLSIPALWWSRPFRPARSFRRRLRRGPALRRLAGVAAAPLTGAADSFFLRRAANELEDGNGLSVRHTTDAAGLLPLLQAAGRRYALRPDYNEEELGWMIRTLSALPGPGRELRGGIVETPAGEPRGWCLYFFNRDGETEVLQLEALRSEWQDPVYRAFCRQALAEGATAVGGRVSFGILDTIRRDRASLSIGERYCMAHTPRPKIRDALLRGDMMFTRLEGEWW